MAFGGAVKLTGESEYRKALKLITQNLKELTSEMKKTDSAYDENDKSVEALTAREKSLNGVLEAQDKKLSILKSKYDSMNAKYQENITKHEKLVKSYDDEKAKLSQIENELGKSSQEYKDQKAVVDKLADSVKKSDENLDQNKLTLSQVRTEMNKAETAYNKTERQVNSLSSEIKDAKNPLKQMKNALKAAAEAADDASNGGLTTFKVMVADLASNVIRKAVSAVKDLATETVTAGANFESAMSKVEAVSGASADQVQLLQEKAQEMGSKTVFSATQSAEAFNYMAMAGWKTNEMLDGIEGIMNLAAASGEDLATTSDIVTDALTAMGYTAKDSGRLADVMAAASSNANTNVSMMGSTFKNVAPIVGALGYSMEDTATAIGLMANSGIKAESAGTALRSILTRLSAPPKECKDAMDKLGLSMTDSSGKMKSLDTVMGDLRTAFSGLSETQQTQYAKSIAGKNAMVGLLAIVNTSATDYKKLSTAIDNSSGQAKKMADTMNDNVSGSMTLLKSQIEGVQIELFKKLSPAFQGALKSASKFIKNIDWDSFGNKVKGAFEKALKGLEWIIKNSHIILGAIKGIIAAFVVTKIYKFTKSLSDVAKGFIEIIKGTTAATAATVANTTAVASNTAAEVAGTTATTALTGATNLLNAAWKANPVGLVLTGVIALGTALFTLLGRTNDVTEAEEKHREELEKQHEAVQQLTESWQSAQETQKKSYDAGMTELSYYEDLWEELQGIVDKNGEVKKGYEERASFITSTLSEALGIEITNTGGVIDKYKELISTIDDTIQKKKAQIILDSQETAYKEALQNQSEALKNLRTELGLYNQSKKDLDSAEEELAAKIKQRDEDIYEENRSLYDMEIEKIKQKIEQRKADVEQHKTDYAAMQDTVKGYAYAIGVYEKNQELAHAGAYSKMATATWDYAKQFQKAEDVQKAITKDDIANTKMWINTLKSMRNNSNKEFIDSQIKASQQQLKEQQNSLKQYESTTKEGTKKATTVWNDSIKEQITKLTDGKVKFEKAAKGNVQVVINGVKVGKPKTKKEMTELVNGMVTAISSKSGDSKQAAIDFINGATQGIQDQNAQSGLFSAINNLGKEMLQQLKSALKEKSPSKATKQMGEYLIEGLSLGIADKARGLLKQVSGVGKSVIDEINAEMQQGVTIGNIDVSHPTTVSQQITSRQREEAYAGMVEAFKTALGQMKIELDDEVAGRFVVNTVAQAVYS